MTNIIRELIHFYIICLSCPQGAAWNDARRVYTRIAHQVLRRGTAHKGFCQMQFGADFPQFQKSDVNGAHALPLYTWLKSQKPCLGGYDAKLAAVMERLYNEANPEPRKKDDIQWNFTKFLIGRDGQVIARFEPTVDMKEVEKQVAAAL